MERHRQRLYFNTRRTELRRVIARLIQETEGQDLIEYALLAATIALGVTTAMGLVRDALQTQFSGISTAVGS